jgi:hypothetical protein
MSPSTSPMSKKIRERSARSILAKTDGAIKITPDEFTYLNPAEFPRLFAPICRASARSSWRAPRYWPRPRYSPCRCPQPPGKQSPARESSAAATRSSTPISSTTQIKAPATPCMNRTQGGCGGDHRRRAKSRKIRGPCSGIGATADAAAFDVNAKDARDAVAHGVPGSAGRSPIRRSVAPIRWSACRPWPTIGLLRK